MVRPTPLVELEYGWLAIQLLTLLMAVLLTASAVLAGHPGTISTITARDCSDGGAYIAASALARDRGAPAHEVLGRLDSDLSRLASAPPAERWFASTPAEIGLVTAATKLVFDDPQPSETHRDAFVQLCNQWRLTMRAVAEQSAE